MSADSKPSGQRRRKTLGILEVATHSAPTLAETASRSLPNPGSKPPEIKKHLLNKLLNRFKGIGNEKGAGKEDKLAVQAPKRRPSVLGVRLPIRRNTKVKAIVDDEKGIRPIHEAEKPVRQLKKSSSLHELSAEAASTRKPSSKSVIPPLPKAQTPQDSANVER